MSINAFNLVPALNKLSGFNFKMTCMEMCGKNLYLGTNDCEIVHLLLEEITNNNRIIFKSSHQASKNLGYKKCIQQIKAASTINRIVILAGSNLLLLSMLNLELIQSTTKIKSITYFAFNSNPLKPNPFNVEIIAATSKKSILFLILKEESILQVKEIMLQENPLTLKINESMVCVGFEDQYQMVDIVSNKNQQLLIIESVKPIIVPISKNEYLLCASNALGVICSAEGVSQRPPIQLQRDIVAISYSHPYIVTISSEIISIYSILDQQPKQVLTFSGGLALEKFNERLFIRTQNDIYALISVPVEQQIESLLDENRIEEAILFCNNVKNEYEKFESFQQIYMRVLLMSGFYQLSKLNFHEAHVNFSEAQLDPREFIILFPGYMPSNQIYQKMVPSLHAFTNIDHLVKGDINKVHRVKRFLFEYLSDLNIKDLNVNAKECVETALMKLHCDFSSYDQLIAYLTTCKYYNYNDCNDYLKNNGKYYAAGLLASFNNDYEMALNIWIQIVNEEVNDKKFPGLEFIADFLSNLVDINLIWKNAEWIFKKDENIAIKIFTGRSQNINHEDVLKFLNRFPNSILKYLNYLIFDLQLEKESYHTLLAQLYIEEIIDSKMNQQLRIRFRNFILSSNYFQVQNILHRTLSKEDLAYETAILHGKLGDHEKAIKIFATHLKDFKAAEAYCTQNLLSLSGSTEGIFISKNSESSNNFKTDVNYIESKFNHQNLLLSKKDASKSNLIINKFTDYSQKILVSQLLFMLLSVYLEDTEIYFEPAMSLLIKNQAFIDSLEVLKLLPLNWSLNILHMFLIGSLRFGINQSRNTKIQKSLATSANFSTKLKLYKNLQDKIQLSENSICSICRKQFFDSSFSILPNKNIAHILCARDFND